MTSPPLRIHSRRMVTPGGSMDAVVEVENGRITRVVPSAEARGSAPVEDVGDAVLMAGLVDTHVHVNEPGRTEWEGFATATRAAASGGVTTLVDMPLNAIPTTTTVEAYREKVRAAEAVAAIDCAFWGGVVPGNAGELEGLAAAGVPGFKCFLVDSGVAEFPPVGEADLNAAMPVLAALGLPLLVHAESPAVIAAAAGVLDSGDRTDHAVWLASRPPEAEVEAIRMMIRLCRTHGARVHIVHLAAAAALADLRAARAEGLPLTIETCPHYLFFESAGIPAGGTQFKCAPPIRDRSNREQLWAALGEGDIDLIASDHSPCPPALKCFDAGDFIAGWGGIASIELGLAAVWTAARERGFGVEHIARWMCERPARLAGLGGRKGSIAPGFDGDLVAWNPDAMRAVDPTALVQRHPVTPYAGIRLTGVVQRVWLRGRELAPASPGRAAGHVRDWNTLPPNGITLRHEAMGSAS